VLDPGASSESIISWPISVYHVYTEGVLESPLVAGCAEQQLMSKSPTPWRPEPTLQAATTWEVSDGDRGFVSDIYVRLGTYLCPMSCIWNWFTDAENGFIQYFDQEDKVIRILFSKLHHSLCTPVIIVSFGRLWQGGRDDASRGNVRVSP
jgi:hypothetical protein